MSLTLRLYACLCACIVHALAQSTDYCTFTPEHTLCQHSVGQTGEQCGSTVAATPTLPANDQNLIVDMHNRLRGLVASGAETRGDPGPQPPAANMRQMMWDEELAQLAQTHAQQCAFEHDCPECRRVERFRVGQNLFTSSSNTREASADWEQAILSWYNEVSMFNAAQVEQFVFEPSVVHYTQLVWAVTDRVGCGFVFHHNATGEFVKLYTCNYGPAGNVRGVGAYIAGDACTQCPATTKCFNSSASLCIEDMEPTTTPAATSTDLSSTTDADVTTVTTDPTPSSTPADAISTTPNSGGGDGAVMGGEQTTMTPGTNSTSNTTVLLACNFDNIQCGFSVFGVAWRYFYINRRQGRVLHVVLKPRRFSVVTFPVTVMENARSNNSENASTACLNFMYGKKHLFGWAKTFLEVRFAPVAQPNNIIRSYVRPDTGAYMRSARLQLSGIRPQLYHLQFRVKTPRHISRRMRTIVAIDDISLITGSCSDTKPNFIRKTDRGDSVVTY